MLAPSGLYCVGAKLGKAGFLFISSRLLYPKLKMPYQFTDGWLVFSWIAQMDIVVRNIIIVVSLIYN